MLEISHFEGICGHNLNFNQPYRLSGICNWQKIATYCSPLSFVTHDAVETYAGYGLSAARPILSVRVCNCIRYGRRFICELRTETFFSWCCDTYLNCISHRPLAGCIGLLCARFKSSSIPSANTRRSMCLQTDSGRFRDAISLVCGCL